MEQQGQGPMVRQITGAENNLAEACHLEWLDQAALEPKVIKEMAQAKPEPEPGLAFRPIDQPGAAESCHQDQSTEAPRAIPDWAQPVTKGSKRNPISPCL